MTSLKDINNKYDFLVPSRLDGGLLLLLLQRKVIAKEIDEEFTRHEIQITLEEIAQLENMTEPRTERILQKLMHFHLKRSKEKSGRYYLSEHAKSFVLFIEHALNSPYRDFPLKKNFEKYFKLDADEIANITDFEAWHQQSFIAASKKVISEHLASLQDELEKAIDQLNTILHSDELSALDMAKEFAEVFQKLDEKREQISDALFYKDAVAIELKAVVNGFYDKIDAASHHQTEEETQAFEKLKDGSKRAQFIQGEVNRFFNSVDRSLERIEEQIRYSSTKLRELQENFKAQSRFKINLRKMLEMTIKESTYGRDTLKLPEWLPQKGLPFEETKLFSIPYYDFELPYQNESLEASIDTDYEMEERAKVERELERQGRIAHWLGVLTQELVQKGQLFWPDRFFEIMETEQDAETALQVGFELVEQVQTDADLHIEFSNTVSDRSQNDFSLWDMTIRKN